MTKEVVRRERAFSKHTLSLLQGRADERDADARERHERRPRMSETAAAEELDVCLDELMKSGAIDVAALVEEVREEVRAEVQRETRRRRIIRFGVATTLIGSLLGVGLVLIHMFSGTYRAQDEPRLVHLSDGSRIELNAHSSIKVRLSSTAREVILKEGEAVFKVSPDRNRPFRVHAGAAIFEAVGTQFNVRRTSDHTVITMLEGVVKCHIQTAASARYEPKRRVPVALVTAGYSLTVDRDGRAGSPVPVDAKAATAWGEYLGLVFADASLAEIADAFNRHQAKPKLIIVGTALRARRFAISFNTASSEELVNYLKNDDSLEFTMTSDEVVIRERDR